MFKEVKEITQSLRRVADEKPPIAPFKGPSKRAPSKFPYSDYSLRPPEDARKITQTLEALNSRAQEIQDMEQNYKEMRINLEQKISEAKQQSGYDKILQEMQGFQEKIVEEAEDTFADGGNILIEYNNTVMTVLEKVTEGKVQDQEIHDKMVAAIEKYAGPEIAGKIIEEADQAINEMKESRKKIQRKLEMWPSPQDLRKKVKEEIPASKTAGVVDVLKGIGNTLKNAWEGIKDKVSDFWNSLTEAAPIVDEMQDLISQSEAQGATASISDDVYQVTSLLHKKVRGLMGEEMWGDEVQKPAYEGDYQEKFDRLDEEYKALHSKLHQHGILPIKSSKGSYYFDTSACSDVDVNRVYYSDIEEGTIEIPKDIEDIMKSYVTYAEKENALLEEYWEEYPPIEGE